MMYRTIPYNVIHHTYSAMYVGLKDDVVMAGPHMQLEQERGPVFHYCTFNENLPKENRITYRFNVVIV